MIQDRVMRSGVAVVLGLAFAFSGMGAWCADAAHVERLPVPPASDLAQARNLVRAAYEPDYAAVDQSGESAPLVAKLRAAADSAVGPLEKYAFLVEAQALATEHDDVAMALAIVDRRGEIFEIDGLAERSQALARLAGPKTAVDLGIMEQATATALKAATVERFDIAEQAATLALNVAKAVDREQKASARRQAQRKQAPGEVVPTPNGAGLIKSAFDLQKRIGRQREMFKACEEAKAVLVSKPEDEAANAAVGTYLCFVADDWEAGLPYLNRSRLPLVSGLARDELAIDVGDQDTKAVFDLAGKWWDAADDKRLADDEKNAIRKHAARLYGGIVTSLNNPLERRVAESRGAPQLAGDKKAVFLSDLPGRDPVVGMGEFGTNGEAGFFGKKIIVNRTLAEKGLSTHCKDGAPVGVTYDVPSMARRFVAAVSVLDDVATQPGGRKNCGSPIIFRLRGENGVVLWTSPKPVEKVGDIFFCDVPVVGQKTLRLEASCAGSDDWCSAVWLNPYFVVSDQPVADALSPWRPATNP